jgi:uncharacterized protein (TIGR00251 family)
LGTEGQLSLTARDGAVRIAVAAKPRARASRIGGVREGALVVQLAAPPVDGAANDELVSVLAAALEVPRRDVALVRGESSRLKLVEVRGLAEAEVRERLARHIV